MRIVYITFSILQVVFIAGWLTVPEYIDWSLLFLPLMLVAAILYLRVLMDIMEERAKLKRQMQDLNDLGYDEFREYLKKHSEENKN